HYAGGFDLRHFVPFWRQPWAFAPWFEASARWSRVKRHMSQSRKGLRAAAGGVTSYWSEKELPHGIFRRP
ncbi:MAG: hypothetical protein ACLU98_01370, partial [Desulfovibrio fairfieldensis]